MVPLRSGRFSPGRAPRTGRALRNGVATVAVAAALGATALTGCETKAGVAGFVGKSPIETTELSGYVDRGAQAAAAAKASISRQDIQQFWLQTLIERDLALRVAKAQGVSTNPSDATVFQNRYAPFNNGPDALRQSAAQIGIAEQDLPTLFQAWTLENELADKVAPTLLAPDSSARQAYDQLKSSYQGQTYEQLAPLLRQLLVFDQRRQAVLPVLQTEARQIGVRINPRFGSWDINRLGIGAPPTDLARPVTPSSTPAPVTSGDADSTGTGTDPGTGTGTDTGTGTGTDSGSDTGSVPTVPSP
jgi:hypothetical protein